MGPFLNMWYLHRHPHLGMTNCGWCDIKIHKLACWKSSGFYFSTVLTGAAICPPALMILSRLYAVQMLYSAAVDESLCLLSGASQYFVAFYGAVCQCVMCLRHNLRTYCADTTTVYVNVFPFFVWHLVHLSLVFCLKWMILIITVEELCAIENRWGQIGSAVKCHSWPGERQQQLCGFFLGDAFVLCRCLMHVLGDWEC